jgi:hypothetical protein
MSHNSPDPHFISGYGNGGPMPMINEEQFFLTKKNLGSTFVSNNTSYSKSAY